MHKTHFLLNLSMLLVLTHINFSVSYLIFTLSLKAFIIGVRFLLQSHIYNLASSIKTSIILLNYLILSKYYLTLGDFGEF